MSAKRKRVVVSLKTKFEAIRRIDNGETIKKVAAELGVGEVTVGDWRRNRAEIEKWCSQRATIGNVNNPRKTMKECEFEKTSEAVFLWFSQMRAKGSPVSGPMLQAKALEFHNRFKDGEGEFTASSGWLDRWKRRYGVRQLSISGEKLSADQNEMTKFRDFFKNLIASEKLSLDQLFNCDETGLNYRMLPAKTLAARDEMSAPGHKKSKERLTILACSNASGNLKLKPMVIGKSKKPRAFKNMEMSNLPVYYRNQKSAWMDATLFKAWFEEEFVPTVEQFLKSKNLPRKALLLLDNAPSHPAELIDGDIKTIFLPPNVTSLIQPLDQGVLENLKRNYKRCLLRALLDGLEENCSVSDCLKKVSLKDVIYWITEAWDSVRPETLERSWRKLMNTGESMQQDGHNSDDDFDEEDNLPLLELLRNFPAHEAIDETDVDNWINADDDVNEYSDDMIATMVMNQEDEQSDSDDDPEEVQKMSHSDGLRALETAISYIEQEGATPSDVMLFRRWRNIAAKKRTTSTKQSSLTDFFKKH